MEKEFLTTEQLREEVEKKWIKHIQLCQDNFLYFVQAVSPDIIMRKDKDPTKWGHHKIMSK